MPKQQPKATNEEFVVAWQSSESLAAAAKMSRMTERAASLRACYMRGKGVDLKKFGEAGERLDVGALAELAKKSFR